MKKRNFCSCITIRGFSSLLMVFASVSFLLLACSESNTENPKPKRDGRHYINDEGVINEDDLGVEFDGPSTISDTGIKKADGETQQPDATIKFDKAWLPDLKPAGLAVTTFAGDGTSTYLTSPRGIISAGSGKFYVADSSKHKILIVEKNKVTTLAGVGEDNFLDGAVDKAKFNSPMDVAMDSAGTIYVADMGNNRIRMIKNGQVTTLAGTGTGGSLDGTATEAQFSSPRAIAVTRDGKKVYVAQGITSYCRIRLINIQEKKVYTVGGSSCGYAKDGNFTSAVINSPGFIKLSTDEKTLYIADPMNNKIRAANLSTNDISTTAGSSQGDKDGTALSAQFKNPMGLTVDTDGTIYISETTGNRIRMLKGGQVSYVAGGNSKNEFADGDAAQAKFNQPYALTVVGGLLYVSDTGNKRIRLIGPK